MSPAEDKRRQRRIPADLWIEVEAVEGVYYQRASNLSAGGAYFTQTFPLPVATRVVLRFSLPNDDQPIECNAEIVSVKDLGMGVQFLNQKDGDRARVEALIDSCPELPSERPDR